MKYSITITRQGPWKDKFTVEINNGQHRTISFRCICIPQTFCQFSRLNLFQLFANTAFFFISKDLGSKMSVKKRNALSFVITQLINTHLRSSTETMSLFR